MSWLCDLAIEAPSEDALALEPQEALSDSHDEAGSRIGLRNSEMLGRALKLDDPVLRLVFWSLFGGI